MPLLRTWESDPYSRAAVWKIGEPESFFAGSTGLNVGIAHPKRRIERLAGRFLLRELQADFPLDEIYCDAQDKPRLPGNRYFFSISHSWPYVAAVISSSAEAGIDIQCPHPRILALRDKFLAPAEQLLVGNEPAHNLMAWSVKEAAYKWQGMRGVDFIRDLRIGKVLPSGNGGGNFNIEIKFNLIEEPSGIMLHGFANQHFALAVVRNP